MPRADVALSRPATAPHAEAVVQAGALLVAGLLIWSQTRAGVVDGSFPALTSLVAAGRLAIGPLAATGAALIATCFSHRALPAGAD